MIVYRTKAFPVQYCQLNAPGFPLAVIANQRARWCGNPLPLCIGGFYGNAQKIEAFGERIATPVCGLVRNDSGSRYPGGTIVHAAINDHLFEEYWI